jgi:hypothetical protein
MEYNYKISFKGKSFFVFIDNDSESMFSNQKISNISTFDDYSDYYEDNDNSEKSWWTTNILDLIKTEFSVKFEYLKFRI